MNLIYCLHSIPIDQQPAQPEEHERSGERITVTVILTSSLRFRPVSCPVLSCVLYICVSVLCCTYPTQVAGADGGLSLAEAQRRAHIVEEKMSRGNLLIADLQQDAQQIESLAEKAGATQDDIGSVLSEPARTAATSVLMVVVKGLEAVSQMGKAAKKIINIAKSAEKKKAQQQLEVDAVQKVKHEVAARRREIEQKVTAFRVKAPSWRNALKQTAKKARRVRFAIEITGEEETPVTSTQAEVASKEAAAASAEAEKLLKEILKQLKEIEGIAETMHQLLPGTMFSEQAQMAAADMQALVDMMWHLLVETREYAAEAANMVKRRLALEKQALEQGQKALAAAKKAAFSANKQAMLSLQEKAEEALRGAVAEDCTAEDALEFAEHAGAIESEAKKLMVKVEKWGQKIQKIAFETLLKGPPQLDFEQVGDVI